MLPLLALPTGAELPPVPLSVVETKQTHPGINLACVSVCEFMFASATFDALRVEMRTGKDFFKFLAVEGIKELLVYIARFADAAEQLEWTADMRTPQVDDDLARLARLRAVQATRNRDAYVEFLYGFLHERGWADGWFPLTTLFGEDGKSFKWLFGEYTKQYMRSSHWNVTLRVFTDSGFCCGCVMLADHDDPLPTRFGDLYETLDRQSGSGVLSFGMQGIVSCGLSRKVTRRQLRVGDALLAHAEAKAQRENRYVRVDPIYNPKWVSKLAKSKWTLLSPCDRSRGLRWKPEDDLEEESEAGEEEARGA